MGFLWREKHAETRLDFGMIRRKSGVVDLRRVVGPFELSKKDRLVWR